MKLLLLTAGLGTQQTQGQEHYQLWILFFLGPTVAEAGQGPQLVGFPVAACSQEHCGTSASVVCLIHV